MEKRTNKEEILKLLSTLKIDKEEFWLLSSSALALRNIYPDAGDIDIAVTDKGLEQLKNNYELTLKENGWYVINEKIECVCDGNKEKLKYKPEKLENGYYVQNIHEYLEYLKQSTREKDVLRIPLVEKYIKNMKFYFAGAIRGGRDKVDVYIEINKLLEKYGRVLDQHVANPNVFNMEQDFTAEEIYIRDINWIKECDILVAEVSTPSLGVGYEIAYAERLGKRIICIYDESIKISAMISGNKNYEFIKYKDLNELLLQLEEKIK